MVSPRKLVGLVLVVTAVVIVAGAATSLLVAYEAEEAAGSQPYCIQIADRTSDYRPARSWLDLSALTMWAKRDGPLYMQHHAILVVGEAANPRLYHWSYRRRTFEPGVLNGQIEGRGPAVTCLPVRDFAGKRLALIPQSSDSNYVRYSAQDTYRIPSVWQAKWSGGMSPTLRLATTAPDFQPLSRRWSDLAPEERDSNWVFVEWNPEWVLSLIRETPSRNVVEQSTGFGLSKTKTVTHGRGWQGLCRIWLSCSCRRSWHQHHGDRLWHAIRRHSEIMSAPLHQQGAAFLFPPSTGGRGRLAQYAAAYP
ncbi:hypothetical protein [Bradyrhizobium liaoningense]|uniref:hypothetical protein n=1 Tax=Bradyrhizobium liaoningense TaxID=43992 RepID=UPI001BA9A4DA|nr:hypothetical protein [Bradyrhizobium liaoningense]MBR0818708.1 hypothetical protein [Bradyrhizobium liaoningense]